MKKNFLIFVCFVLSVCSLKAQAFLTPQTVPNPKDATHNGWISDPYNVLNNNAEYFIDSICTVLKKTVDVEMAVVVIWSYDEEKYDALDFCQTLFEYWGIGSVGNKGVLVFLSVATSDIRIHTGGGMEGLLPDGVCYQIIEDNKPYFKKGKELLHKGYEVKQQGDETAAYAYYGESYKNFSDGMALMCRDISDVLLTDEAKQELLLGWKPKPVDTSFGWLEWYLILSFVVFIWVGVKMSKVEPKAEDLALDKRADSITKLSNAITFSRIYALCFPLPILFFLLILRKHEKNLRKQPATCDNCNGKMTLLPQTEDISEYLTDIQKKEYELKSRSFDVWQCEDCKKTQVLPYAGTNSRYSECTQCGGVTSGLESTKVIEHATHYRSGYGIRTYVCAFCGAQQAVKYVIPRIERSSSSGGRRSSGGSSGGSWGGGHSYGGGAGSKF